MKTSIANSQCYYHWLILLILLIFINWLIFFIECLSGQHVSDTINEYFLVFIFTDVTCIFCFVLYIFFNYYRTTSLCIILWMNSMISFVFTKFETNFNFFCHELPSAFLSPAIIYGSGLHVFSISLFINSLVFNS